MIEGKKILQISALPRNLDGSQSRGLIEIEHNVLKFRRYLPAGPMADGTVRKEALLQFYADRGYMRTVIARDIAGVVVGKTLRGFDE